LNLDLLDINTSPAQLHMRKALEQMNAADTSQQRRAQLLEASLKVRNESMRVNAEFDAIEDTPHA